VRTVSNRPDSAVDSVAWVDRQLRTYCAPSHHEFHEVDLDGSRSCTVCFKEERGDGHSCVVCSVFVGTADAVLVEDEEPVPGALCGVCKVGIRSASGGRSWWVSRADPSDSPWSEF
jgi:hypothetical protein